MAERRGQHVIRRRTGAAALESLFGRLTTATADKAIDWFENRITYGQLTLQLPDGQTRWLQGTQRGPQAHLQLHDWAAVRRLFVGGDVGFAEAYIDGLWDSDDLPSLIEFAARNPISDPRNMRGQVWSRLMNRVIQRFNANSRTGSRRNISYHYDLGNGFYKSWLDDTMAYSSAIFETPHMDLRTAQENKFQRLLDIIDPKPGDHILEIGSGWGGFALAAAQSRKARVTSITISQEQYALARKRVDEAQMGSLVDIQMRDYRDVQGQYDHVASIEMFEAVGQQYWRTYFDKISTVLKPGGRAGLQIITIDDDRFEAYARKPDFIQTHIFPGGMLPSLSKLYETTTAAGLRVLGHDGFALHYARTLSLWRERFEGAWGKLQDMGFDDHFRRLWRYYLAYCEGGFRAGTIDVVQMGLVKA